MSRPSKIYNKILVVGAAGGREHSIGWKLKQSPRCGELFFARGNAGTSQIGSNLDFKETEIDKILEFVKTNSIDLVLVVSDDPLALGAVDELEKARVRVWGPRKDAAQLEWSKAYSKDFMRRHSLPTARFETFTVFAKAKDYLLQTGSYPIVIKASGLALGKGVVIAQSETEALKTLEDFMVKKIFGASGEEVVIEEFIEGPEISVHAFLDGKNYKIFPISQDHKRAGEGDTGLNTGGMGTIAPVPLLDLKEVEEKIVAPTLAGLIRDGIIFKGLLYPGLMLTKDGPKILEYNTRFGDPETETYMRLLDSDLLDIIDASIDGKLNEVEIKWKPSSACTVMLASGGYPGDYQKGKTIITGAIPEDVVIFHAGTKINDEGELVTNGGRVMGVSATGNDLKKALGKAYEAINSINFEGMHFRRDIGKKTLDLLK